MTDFAAIWAEAEEAGQRAMRELSDRYSKGASGQGLYDGGACGFAWVNIRPARGKFVNWCKAQNKIATEAHEKKWPQKTYGDNGWPTGWQLWKPGSKGYHGQSIDMYEAASRAFAEVLIKHGIPATTGSRLD